MFVSRTRHRWTVIALLPLMAGGVAAVLGAYWWASVQLAYATSHGSAWISPMKEQLERKASLGCSFVALGALLLVVAGTMIVVARRRTAR